MLGDITPKDNEADDNEFTVQEVKNAVASMGTKNEPGKDGIPSEVS